MGVCSFQNCSSGTDCCTVVWDLSRLILVVYCGCYFSEFGDLNPVFVCYWLFE